MIVPGVGGILSCLDAGSGKILWREDPFPKMVPRFFASNSPIVAEMETYAHPILAGKRIFVKDQETVTLWTVE